MLGQMQKNNLPAQIALQYPFTEVKAYYIAVQEMSESDVTNMWLLITLLEIAYIIMFKRNLLLG